MVIDLHNHSYYSDGILSPTEVVRLANKQNCDMFALTDHDTIDGLDEASFEANKLNLKFVFGTEISAIWNNMTIHILGLNINPNNKILQIGLKKHQQLREVRSEKIARSLEGVGIIDAMKKTKDLTKTGIITRTHFAQMLIQEGICKNMRSVFRNFLTGNNPGGVSVKWAQFDEVIGWIRSAGGVAVLAHPLRYRITHTQIKRMASDLAINGCTGIEVVTAMSSLDEIILVSHWSSELGLLESSGSDYHGWPNQRVQIGCLQDLPNYEQAIWKNWTW
ncbi:PHP domain-containing protein [Candidatus Vesicomyidisocius sp. SY067_SCS001]|uniref:PHP domain-containing protein n=1 Tax=Candidatus Vesicomyidisocius sp. SY067_SCS001 TaxID=2732590 RepID=UPI0016853B75|nr:PHP domain-containing protein [Candidatus Vesicomyosocius sp. SY067_SCS001]